MRKGEIAEMEEEDLERECGNCAHFFPASMEPTEFGICLDDEEFGPFIEGLFERSDYASCRDLIERKKFSGDREPCDEYEEMETIEIDDDTELGRSLKKLMEAGELTPDTFEEALLKEQIRNIDWTTIPVDSHEADLKNPDPEKRDQAISSLSGLIAMGNKEAFRVLFKFLRDLPVPGTIEAVHFKKRLLRLLHRPETRDVLTPYLLDELYRTPSNNTTRQWMSDILTFFEHVPVEQISSRLEAMIQEGKFSYRLRKRIEEILER